MDFKTCPACGYVRQPNDDAPEWECPKCQKAYNKTSQSVQQYEIANKTLRPPSVWKQGMIIQRSIFFVTKAVMIIGGGLWGLAGSAYISEQIFKINPSSGPLLPMILLAAIGSASGLAGAWFLFVLPLHFLFPNARQTFSWESTDPSFIFRFYKWYGKQLEAYSSARERGEF